MNNNTQESKIQLEYINKCTELVKEKYEKAPAFFIQNAGCQMNSLQTDTVAGIVKRMGYTEVSREEDADVVIYNTCTVRENANLKIYGHLGHLKSIKKKNPELKIILFGCMMQEPEVIEKIHKEYSFVDLVFGTHNFHKFPELFYRSLNTEGQIIDVWKESDEIVEGMPSDRKYSFKTGVNIMFGCNNFCSYCIVPYVRGREKSREPEAIIEEIKGLVADGVTEVMLLGQNVNSYGKTLEHPVTFAQLLKQVEAIEGLKRIRFMTSHPKDLSDELIRTMAESKKVCHHLHLPMQSGSSRILKIMNRRYDKEKYLELVAKIRNAVPDISLTTDIIVGFPGETEEDFQDTLDVVEKCDFDSAFTFIYSKRTGTKAAEMPDPTPRKEKTDRMTRLLKVQDEIAMALVKAQVGQTVKVLVEGFGRNEGTLSGRLDNNLTVEFTADASLMGSYANVHLTGARATVLLGELA